MVVDPLLARSVLSDPQARLMSHCGNLIVNVGPRPTSPPHPMAPTAISRTRSVTPLIVAGLPTGLHGVLTASWSAPATLVSCTVTAPEDNQGRLVPLAVPEMLTYGEHEADGRNVAQTSMGAKEAACELRESGVGAGTAVPGPPVVGAAQDVIRIPQNRKADTHGQN